MKIKKFRILNYKSIIDSQDCYPAERVTIFAGKNESGKSSILEALENFNTDKQINEKAIPIQYPDKKPKIQVWFAVSKNEFKEIRASLETEKTFPTSEQVIMIEKEYPEAYSFGQESAKLLGYDQEVLTRKFRSIKNSLEKAKKIGAELAANLGGIAFPEITTNTYKAIKEGVSNYKTHIEPHLANIPQDKNSLLIKELDTILQLCQECLDDVSFRTKLMEEFKNYIPNFILFVSFEDVFPNIVPIGELDSNQWINDLAEISNLDTAVIKSNNDRNKVTHKKDLNIQLNKDFKNFWEQDLSKLAIEWDNEKLTFWIEEDGHHFEPEIRSQGRRWHLAFYIKVTARAREDQPNVILIDEPGLYLHAKAQQDILKKLEESSQKAPIYFSTHSPYLIEANKLERVRLVLKTTKKGTVIENKIHKVSDKDTLTPILTAIGLEMANSITEVDKVDNIVIEGPSDWYYLQAFKKISQGINLNFIYGGGSGNMPKVGTILHGWGCNVLYLYDNDQGVKDAEKNLKSEWLVTSKDMLDKIPIPATAIEDIFTIGDYKKFILKDESLTHSESNSEYAKIKKRDKVLDAKLFLESLHSQKITLEQQTKDNIQKLFESVTKKLTKLKKNDK